MKEPTPITMDELFSEMEKLRKTPKNMELTDIQVEFLKRARTGQKIVSFPDLAVLWERAGWGKERPEFIRNQYARLKELGKL
jgi:hypothetical protein